MSKCVIDPNLTLRYLTIVGFPIALVASGYWDPLLVGLWFFTENLILILWEGIKSFFYKNPKAHYKAEDIANAAMLFVGISIFSSLIYRMEFGLIAGILEFDNFHAGRLTNEYLKQLQQSMIIEAKPVFIKLNFLDFIFYLFSSGTWFMGVVVLNLILMKAFIMEFIALKQYKSKKLNDALVTIGYLWLLPVMLILIGAPLLLLFQFSNLMITLLFCLIYVCLDIIIQFRFKLFSKV